MSEALIAEGSVSAACDLMQAAVERRIAAAAAAGGGGDGDTAADHHVHITHACTLAVAGAPSHVVPALRPTPTHTHAPLPGLYARAKEALGQVAAAAAAEEEEEAGAAALCRAYIALRSAAVGTAAFLFCFAAADA